MPCLCKEAPTANFLAKSALVVKSFVSFGFFKLITINVCIFHLKFRLGLSCCQFMLIYWVFGVNVMCPISISIITYASFQLSNIKVLAGQDHHLTEMNNFFFSFQYANHVLPFSARVVTSPSPEILDVSVLMWTGTSTHPNSQTKASCHLLQSLRCTDIAQSSAFPSPGLPESDSLTHRLSSGLGTGM